MDDEPTAGDPGDPEDGHPVDDAEDEDEPEEEHPYRPCACTRFRLVETDEPDGTPAP